MMPIHDELEADSVPKAKHKADAQMRTRPAVLHVDVVFEGEVNVTPVPIRVSRTQAA